MPNIKSAKKRAKQSVARCERNTSRKSTIKSSIKKFIEAIDSKNIDEAKTLLKRVESQIASAQGKGLLHANTASRKISRLAKKVAAVERAQK